MTTFLASLCFAICLPTLLSFLDRLHWTFDLLTSFRLHYLVAAAALAASAVWLDELLLAALMGLCAVTNLTDLFRTPRDCNVRGPARRARLPSSAETPRPLKVTTVNLSYANPDLTSVERYLAHVDPDVVVVQECHLSWPAKAPWLLDHYPYRLRANRKAQFSHVLLSAHPVRRSCLIEPNSHTSPPIAAEIMFENRSITFIALHAPSPRNLRDWEARNCQFREISKLVRASQDPVVVAGDFNATDTSHHLRSMMQACGLSAAPCSLLSCATWPTHIPLLRVQIDHVLSNDRVRTIAQRRGHNIGSDHFPLSASLELVCVAKGWRQAEDS